MPTKTCNTCNLTLDISNFGKTGKYYRNKCKKCTYNSRKCEHGRQKAQCNEDNCNGSGLCVHKRRKARCNEGDCNGSAFCKHGRQKATCNEGDCNGSGFCKHKRLKATCNEGDCNGSRFCKHGRQKAICCLCDGSSMCIHCKHIQGVKRYVKSLDKKVNCCARCFYHFYPSDKIPRRFKLKQHYFNEKLIEEFGVNFFQYDKEIKCGCSKRRPDWFIDCFNYSIIIELDEDQHKYTSCDEKRMMELFKDLGDRPLVLIRINPDKYKIGVEKIEGCFDFDEKNILICNEKEFNKRFNTLVKMIEYHLDNKPVKEVTTETLFFDNNIYLA